MATLYQYNSKGQWNNASYSDHSLFLLPKTKTLWYAIYHPYGENTVQITSTKDNEIDLDNLIGLWSRHKLIEKRSIEVPEL